jgi:hypothetical protein
LLDADLLNNLFLNDDLPLNESPRPGLGLGGNGKRHQHGQDGNKRLHGSPPFGFEG